MTIVTTKVKQFMDACCLEVEVGTTGECGGDGGHGGRTYLRLCNSSNADMTILATEDSVTLQLMGDAEMRCLIGALEFAVNVLKDGETCDDNPYSDSPDNER